MNNGRIFLSPPHMGELELEFIKEAFASNYIAPMGPMVDAFEKEFAEKIGVKYALALSSGTAAIHLALQWFSISQGDEVIASTLTFIGGVSPIVFQDAKPVFIDSDRSTWNMDLDLLAEELEASQRRGKMPKAVVPTDLYGQCCDLPQIVSICNQYDIPVVCDSAEAMGAFYLTQRRKDANGEQEKDNSLLGELGGLARENYCHAGAGAKAAIYSFNGNKIITTSGGGMLVSDDKDLIEQARFLSQQARDPFVHYEHTEIGYNYRMSNILAAIGRGQLRVLDERVKRKREIYDYYKRALENLSGIEFMPEASYGRSNRWLTVILITPEEFGADREKVRLALEAENIEARPVWKPMHLQQVFNPHPSGIRFDKLNATRRDSVNLTRQAVTSEFHRAEISQITTDSKGKKKYPCRVVGGEVAEDLFNRGLCLPSGTAMTDSDLDRIIAVIKKCRK